jgi:hypothetical protein
MVCQGRTYLPILIHYWVNILFSISFYQGYIRWYSFSDVLTLVIFNQDRDTVELVYDEQRAS